MWRQLSYVSCVLWFTCAAHAEEPAGEGRRVSVSGTAVALVQPDTVVWSIQIRRTDATLSKAVAACDDTVKKLLVLREEWKLPASDVQSGRLSISKIFDRDMAGNQTSFRHFLVERQVTIRQRDVSRFDELLARFTAMTDVEVGNTLETSAFHEQRARTRLEAVKVAKTKAAAMTELLGGKLGRVIRISEPRDSGFAMNQYLITSNTAFAAPAAATPDSAPTTFVPGAIEVKVSVDVVFEIE